MVDRGLNEMGNEPLRVVALRDADSISLELSASGGAFPLLARPILEDGGVVFGSEMLQGGEVRHVMIESVADLSRLQGSKYVKSATGGTFDKCADLLREGRTILYSGTPCQIFALRSYLRLNGFEESDLDRLYTVDLICHGVTNPALFKLYIAWLENIKNAISGSLFYRFRSKQQGWGLYYHFRYVSKRSGKIVEQNGQWDEDPYYAAYLSGKFYLKSCYSCKFANRRRVGDFTIGDYWGIEREHPGFEYEKGASVVLINTPKGMAFFSKRCEAACILEESSFELAAKNNRNLNAPAVRSANDAALAERVEEAVRAGDAELVFGKLLKRPSDLKRAMRNMIPHSVRIAAKRMLYR